MINSVIRKLDKGSNYYMFFLFVDEPNSTKIDLKLFVNTQRNNF